MSSAARANRRKQAVPKHNVAAAAATEEEQSEAATIARWECPVKAPVLDWSLAVGPGAEARGAWSLALGKDAKALGEGSIYIGKQLTLCAEDMPHTDPEHYQLYINMFRSDEMQLWLERRAEHYTIGQFNAMVKWINTFCGEDVFA